MIVTMMKYSHLNKLYNRYNEFETISHQLKNSYKSVLKLLVSLFNIVLHTGRVPTQWCLGIILSLYKNKRSRDDPNNYGGIRHC